MTPLPRRAFIQGAAGSIAASWTILATNPTKAAPSERINIAVMGVRGRGRGLAAGFAGMQQAQVTHLCEVDENVVPRVVEAVRDRQGSEPELVTDVRRLLDDPAVDALVIATPDHWHALATIWACQAGKHVYVEKPATHCIAEGRLMIEAARKYDRVVQVGTQSRSAPGYLDMIDALRSGRIGKVLVAKAWNSQRRPDTEPQGDAPTPSGVDYDLWLGPAPERSFNPNHFHYLWHWHWDYGTGDIGNDGVHDLDIARWGLGVGLPNGVHGLGAKLVNQNWETPDTFSLAFTFPDTDVQLLFEQRDWSPYLQEGFENGVAFYGTEGYILAGRAGWKLFEGNDPVPVERKPFSDDPHRQDFLDCIQNGGRPHADIEEGHHSAALAHLGNILYRVGRSLTLDPSTESIVGDTEANALLSRSYREPFTMPESI